MFVKEDGWLSQITGRKCGAFSVGEGQNNNFPADWDFVSAKLAADDHGQINTLQQAGFRFIEAAVTFQRLPQKNDPVGSIDGIEIIDRNTPVSAEIAEMVGHIAETRFVHNRFSVDPNFGPAVGGQIKRAWASNFFAGKRGNKILLAKDKDRVTGFLILLETADHLVIDLIATAADNNRKGTGRRLTRQAIALATARNLPILVGTQASNTASCKLYQACGFTLSHINCSLHWHAQHDR